MQVNSFLHDHDHPFRTLFKLIWRLIIADQEDIVDQEYGLKIISLKKHDSEEAALISNWKISLIECMFWFFIICRTTTFSSNFRNEKVMNYLSKNKKRKPYRLCEFSDRNIKSTNYARYYEKLKRSKFSRAKKELRVKLN